MFYSTTCVRFGTGTYIICLEDFLGSLFTIAIRLSVDARYCQVRLAVRICLYCHYLTLFNLLFRQQADVSLLRLPVTNIRSNGILTVSSIGLSSRIILRSRLTLIRLALIRKPWSCGEGVSRPLYRYLYLHLLFQGLQHTSRCIFCSDWNAPLPIIFHSFGNTLMPDYYPCGVPRLVRLLRTL